MFYKREVISDQYFLFVGIFLRAEGNKCSRCSQMGDGEGVGGSAKGENYHIIPFLLMESLIILREGPTT